MSKKDEVAVVEGAEFYPTAEAKELSYSTKELEYRLELTRKIVANLAIIREQSVGLDVLGSRIASLATALMALHELGRESAAEWKPKEAS